MGSSSLTWGTLIKPRPPALGEQSLSYLTREVPKFSFFCSGKGAAPGVVLSVVRRAHSQDLETEDFTFVALTSTPPPRHHHLYGNGAFFQLRFLQRMVIFFLLNCSQRMVIHIVRDSRYPPSYQGRL